MNVGNLGTVWPEKQASCYQWNRFCYQWNRLVATISSMSLIEVNAWKCDREECGHVWLAIAEEPPTACAKCKNRAWNRGGIVPADKPHVEHLPFRAVLNASTIVREVASPIVVHAAIDLCTYTEYNQDTGESYGCSLPLGHRMKHKRGAKL